MSILPSEIYNIIISYIPIEQYYKIRGVCCDWYYMVETSPYCEVLKFIRMISNSPTVTYICDMGRVEISYWNGVVKLSGMRYVYKDGKLMCTDMEHHVKLQDL